MPKTDSRDPAAVESNPSAGKRQKVSDFLLARLRDWGVSRVYGYSGDGINGLLGAFGRAGNRPEFIQPCHEELCALMAVGHAKFTGELGVCMATQGPGAVHLLNGLYDAKLDHQPVLAIVGQVARSARGSYFMQEIDLVTLLKDVAHEFVEVLSTADQARHVIDRAVRVALAERTVTAIIVPHDVQDLEAEPEPEQKHGKMKSSIAYSEPRVVPQDADLRRAAELLNSGEKVAILAGAGALGATDELLRIAECLGAGVAKALLGKAAVPDDLPFVTGTVGWLGTRASNWMMKQCDTLLIVGSGFPYAEFLPAPGQARCVQIDRDARVLGVRYPSEVNLVGDATETLAALAPLLQRRERPFRREVEQHVEAWAREAQEIAARPAKPINPALVFAELSKRLPDGCILCGDSGSGTFWYGQMVRLRKGMSASLSGTLATMGSAIPYALAAKLNHPQRPVIAFAGDGAMQMNGINALVTVAQRQASWADRRFVVLVLNNRELSYVTWEQRVMEGDPKFSPSQDLFDFSYAKYAELLGLTGIRVDQPSRVGEAWEQALSADGPVVLEILTDANVPTLPPELTKEQKVKLEKALSAGDPDEVRAREQLKLAGKLPA
jgi:pyruvate dehydrogenase (quinone)